MSTFQGQGHRLGGGSGASSGPSSSTNAARSTPSTAAAVPVSAVQPGYATTPADLSSIPMAEVVSGPPAGSGAPQTSVPNAQMAYTVRPTAQRPQGEPVVILDPALARYLAAQEQGMIPPAPPDYLPLSVCSCFCCWPVAFVAIYHSRLVRFFYARGQYLQAYEASRRAKQFALCSIVLGSITLVAYYFMLQRRRGG